MSEKQTVMGMVLRTMPVGENDKRVTILTKERGKITAFARGARRQTSQLLAATEPFSFGTFEVYEGKNAYTVVAAKIQNYFRELVLNLEWVSYGFYFLEMADYYAQENANERERLKLLYQTLRALESDKFPLTLVKVIYELKTMALNGEYPNVFQCQTCGKKEELDYFQYKRQGTLCRSCAEKEKDPTLVFLDGSVLYAMQFIITTPVEHLYTFRLKEDALQKMDQIMTTYRRRFEEHRFHAEDFLP